MSQVVKVQQVTKIYGKTTAVDRISFEMREGEVVGLLGPNGAGKSTTIHMLLSLLEPTKGIIEIFGKDLRTHREEILQHMNFATSYSMLPHNLTPYENLKVFALLYGVKNWKEKANSLLEEFNLGAFRNARTGALSSGEQMRLVLAKAFLNDPKLLLLDEPTSSLDPAVARDLRRKIYYKMEELNGTILWTSHNMREIEAMCDRIIFLAHGKIVADDTPENLKIAYQKDDLEEIFITIAEQPSRV
ncbi:MAG: ABC transporter ATP-binding protein [Candidatus Wildermuthbacteria bacterium RIFCSPLOWO2_02_FULL_47_9c]|uniref:ABC transporter related-protein n=2 Tax=Parcubacteria group TaxID=1794811 RepID=A0A837IKK1_9BACT|nr:MAG: ABC transporter related-protein [Candidatus Yanofskybacteria bacterium GW2011_GWC1_48_11]KKW04045.1 MAG: ABC transporter related-protein [Parcubacteria group bacterium GW2011_GWB1_49_12]KKW08854.1 MAG: ABC transporter related-protein [Parcubacteria group bacterium GW2011_GWA1_49_26]KKW13831.1 MAG: ABC transporter related-protein [Parcubacteria group bacterium GW2011_GWA2_50_10]OHA61777.1 MAG: ABC transporter ATP-binding protein [Candidatus Wildermuthbacteria bacterium GWA1_49_26]OHA656